jgi:hypothetical protein
MAVLDRVEMQIVHMGLEVGTIPDQMFPITSLPNPAFT